MMIIGLIGVEEESLRANLGFQTDCVKPGMSWTSCDEVVVAC